MTEKADVLAFGAHPDDVELGAGGLLLKLAAKGYAFAIADATRGEKGTRGTPEIRAAEAAEAAKRLGARARVNLDLPDCGVLPSDDARRRAVDAIRRFRPVIVVGPRADDLHPDHAHLAAILKDAAFLAGVAKYGSGAPHRPRAVLEYASHTTFEPSFVVDITAVFAQKRDAALAYRSQFHDPASTEPATYISGPRFWGWWEGAARHYGRLIGAEFGEPYRVAGPLKVEDPVALFAEFGYYPR